MRRIRGFTLVELMIVVAIIAIIAAIAIPSLLRSRIAANETAAVSGLRNIHAVEAAHRQNDTDGNGLPDFWSADWSGFFRMADAAGMPNRLVDVSIMRADVNPAPAGAPPRPYLTAILSAVAVERSGYYFRAMLTDNSAPPLPYAADGPDGDANAFENPNKYAFTAFPAAYSSSGVNVFLTTEDGIVWGRDLGGVGPGPAVAPNPPGGQTSWPGAPGSSDLSAGAAPWRVLQ